MDLNLALAIFGAITALISMLDLAQKYGPSFYKNLRKLQSKAQLKKVENLGSRPIFETAAPATTCTTCLPLSVCPKGYSFLKNGA